jgi:D-sedoheptulose 7-phosphate isomerase
VAVDDDRALTGVRDAIAAAAALTRNLQALAPEAARAAGVLESAFADGHRLYACGNGGSAADAQHLAAELVGRFALDRVPLPAVALTTDTSTITAVANDFGYEQVFARQLAALASPGDVLVAISTSGSSPSILEAARVAREAGVVVVGLTGACGDRLRALCDCCLVVPSNDTPRIQEGHAVLIHALCAIVEESLFGPASGRGRSR